MYKLKSLIRGSAATRTTHTHTFTLKKKRERRGKDTFECICPIIIFPDVSARKQRAAGELTMSYRESELPAGKASIYLHLYMYTICPTWHQLYQLFVHKCKRKTDTDKLYPMLPLLFCLQALCNASYAYHIARETETCYSMSHACTRSNTILEFSLITGGIRDASVTLSHLRARALFLSRVFSHRWLIHTTNN